MQKNSKFGDGFLLGFIAGIIFVILTYLVTTPIDECVKYKQVVEEQNAIIQRYQEHTDTMMAIIDELLKEDGE